MRLHTRTDRTLHLEPVGDLHWDRGSVNAGADIALGPSGLLLVADEQRGRVVMVDPESGAVRGVRLEGIRVDTDVAQYAGIAWDGYNDRTAMFDRSTGQLIVDSPIIASPPIPPRKPETRLASPIDAITAELSEGVLM